MLKNKQDLLNNLVLLNTNCVCFNAQTLSKLIFFTSSGLLDFVPTGPFVPCTLSDQHKSECYYLSESIRKLK